MIISTLFTTVQWHWDRERGHGHGRGIATKRLRYLSNGTRLVKMHKDALYVTWCDIFTIFCHLQMSTCSGAIPSRVMVFQFDAIFFNLKGFGNSVKHIAVCICSFIAKSSHVNFVHIVNSCNSLTVVFDLICSLFSYNW